MLAFPQQTKKYIGALFMLITMHRQISATNLSSLAKNDPYPVYKVIDPQEFLYTWQTLCMKGIPAENGECCQDVSIAVSPFGQTACSGKNFCGEYTPLGDLNGRWSMVGLLMGPLPQGKTLPPTLLTALQNLFPGIAPGTLTDPNIIDPNQTFGFFSVPLRYNKRGFRWEFALNLGHNLGFIFQGGLADIIQKVQGFDNLTCLPCPYPSNATNCRNVLSIPYTTEVDSTTNLPINATQTDVNIPTIVAGTGTTPPPSYNALNPLPQVCCDRICDYRIPCCGRFFSGSGSSVAPIAPLTTEYPSYTTAGVQEYLMNQLQPIAREIGLDICNYHKIGLEDFRFEIFWRRAHMVNKGRATWAEFLFIPYLEFGGSVALSETRPNQAFAAPLGNNGHNSIGATGGINFDFVETVEVGAEAGVTHFFPRTFCDLRIPNQMCGRQPGNQCQLGIYPFTTQACVQPGLNWHFAAKLQAWHFIDRLSFLFQYVLVQHEHDHIRLINPDPAFAPSVLEAQSNFTAQLGNISLYYDISPNLNVGALVQAPLNEKNAYRSTTVMISLWATF